MADKVKIGLVGCGNISPQYFKWTRSFQVLDLVACADLDVDLAKSRSSEFEVPKGCSVDDLLADPDIEIVINLTVPKVHALVNEQILESGKHAHTEKPFAVEKEDGKKVLDLAVEKGLRTGGAPDTFLGGGIQTCRKLIDDGWIGDVEVFASDVGTPLPITAGPDGNLYYATFDHGGAVHVISPEANS